METNVLLSGFYTYKQASQLLEMNNAAKISNWARTQSTTNQDFVPLIGRDFKDHHYLSFFDLIELRFIKTFRDHGVSVQTLRKAAKKIRDECNITHAFARNLNYITDGKNIFVQSSQEAGDTETYNILTGQHEIWEAIKDSTLKGITFNPESYIAESWRPRPDLCKNVIINPHYAYGKPVIGDNHIPTSILYKQYLALKKEINNLDKIKSYIANWFYITADDVSEAIRFETALTA